jgi:hypothetical protein
VVRGRRVGRRPHRWGHGGGHRLGERRRPATRRAATEKAIAAALQYTGGGTVIETEAGDDGAAYGVEIRLANGRAVEVGLDANFKVIGQESDDEASADAGSNGD